MQPFQELENAIQLAEPPELIIENLGVGRASHLGIMREDNLSRKARLSRN